MDERVDSSPKLMAEVLMEMANILEASRTKAESTMSHNRYQEEQLKTAKARADKSDSTYGTLARACERYRSDEIVSKKRFEAFEQCVCDLIRSTKPDKKAIAKLRRTLEPVYDFFGGCGSSSPILDAISYAAIKIKHK